MERMYRLRSFGTESVAVVVVDGGYERCGVLRLEIVGAAGDENDAGADDGLETLYAGEDR